MRVGFSEEYTAKKEEYYSKILGWQIGVATNAIQKWKLRTDYLLIDATAGSGIVEGLEGSPLVALEQLRLKMKGPWRAVFLEEDKKTFEVLLTELLIQQGLNGTGVTARNECYQSYLDGLALSPKQFGLLYVDENGVPDFAAIQRFAQRNEKMDILVSLTATGVKRKNGALSGKSDTPLPRLEELTKLKNNTLIREPYGDWQWTFVLASNGPFDKSYTGIQLFPLNTPRGREYFERANHTQEELNGLHQITLPNI